MKYTFLLLLFVVSHTCFAQYPEDNPITQYPSDYNYRDYPIIKDNIKKPGIYVTFEEFRNNAPSIPLQSKIVPVEIKYKSGTFSEPGFFICYKLDMTNEEARQLGNVYGFSDGTKFYLALNPKDPERINNPSFYGVTYVGKYCVYDVMYSSGTDNLTFYDKGTFIIDMNTGDTQMLTGGRLKRIIADDKELLAEFKGLDKKGDAVKKEYLLRYLKAERP
jgi:hypothetical protein